MAHPLERDLDLCTAAHERFVGRLPWTAHFHYRRHGFCGCLAGAKFCLGERAPEAACRVMRTVLTRDPERFRRKCPEVANDEAVDLLTGDVTTFKFPEGSFEYLIHAATNKGEPYATFWRDIQGTQRVSDFAAGHGTKRFLFTSSGAVYGKQRAEISHVPESYLGAPETTDKRSAYGHAKQVSGISLRNAQRGDCAAVCVCWTLPSFG